MSKLYEVYFFHKGSIVISKRINATSEEEAGELASYALMCRFPNIKFDRIKVKEVTHEN